MNNLLEVAKQLERVAVRECGYLRANERFGYIFRNGEGVFDGGAMAQTSNQELSFYAPKNNNDYNGSFRWFDGNWNEEEGYARSVLMTLNGEGLVTVGDVTGFANLSDSNYKENVVAYDGWKEALEKLRPVSFVWNAEVPFAKKAGTEDVGLIAQEVREAYPYAHDIQEMNGKEVEIVRYEKLVPLLLAVVKDQQKRLEELEKKVAGL